MKKINQKFIFMYFRNYFVTTKYVVEANICESSLLLINKSSNLKIGMKHNQGIKKSRFKIFGIYFLIYNKFK